MMYNTYSTHIPVLLGTHYEHVMAHCNIVEDDKVVNVSITLSATGVNAATLVALLRAGEPMGLSFVAVPIVPRNPDI